MANELISMFKDGQTIDVNPLCVDNHKSLGWKVLEQSNSAAETADKKTDKGKGKKNEADSAAETNVDDQPKG